MSLRPIRQTPSDTTPVAVDRDRALFLFGLDETRLDVLDQLYNERLAALQHGVMAAPSDAVREAYFEQLDELVAAYELLTGSPLAATAKLRLRPQLKPDYECETIARSQLSQALEPGTEPQVVALSPGTVLADRLVIHEMLRQGGMGIVYAAFDHWKGEEIAIKILREDLRFSASAKERFLTEARISCQLSHPNIVRVHDVGVVDGHYFFMMERLKGQTLRDRIREQRQKNEPFPLQEALRIMHQLIDALIYAHQYLVHRDLKPENIWINHDGKVKLMDFGIARAVSRPDLTDGGAAMGTAYYMAPEQVVDARSADWRADQYSLGVILYEMLTGTIPMGALQHISLLRPDLPKPFAQAIMSTLAPDPNARLSSLGNLRTERRSKRSRMRRSVGLEGSQMMSWPLHYVLLAILGAVLITALVVRSDWRSSILHLTTASIENGTATFDPQSAAQTK